MNSFLNFFDGEAVRVIAIVAVCVLSWSGVFFIDYHRKSVPKSVLIVLWVYWTVVSMTGLGVVVNLVAGPQPTPGVYVFAVSAALAAFSVTWLSIKSTRDHKHDYK